MEIDNLYEKRNISSCIVILTAYADRSCLFYKFLHFRFGGRNASLVDGQKLCLAEAKKSTNWPKLMAI